jgi:UDP-2,3-diacylglucosamine pyrophosphatase LpxH
MRRLLRIILLKPVLWAAEKFSSKPNRQRVFEALSKLFENILQQPGKRGFVIPFEEHAGKFIIFSDQHKGARNGADDFMLAEPNYLAALEYYCKNNFMYINLGDSEELWKNSLTKVKKYNTATFEAEKKFLEHNLFVKIFGNHDLYWDNDPFAWWQLKDIYKEKLKVYEGVILPVSIDGKTLQIYCTHGHQGDEKSDGNWFSKFFVANIWAPLEAFLRINPNTPANNEQKKTLHNSMMYEWSSQQENLLLVTGHTHQPVFGSLTELEKLYKQLLLARKENDAATVQQLQQDMDKRKEQYNHLSPDYLTMKPTYFNSGCCCFNDGDITGIEITDGCIRLIKWEMQDGHPQRVLLEEALLKELLKQL